MLVIGPMPHIRLSVLGSLFFLIGGGIPVAMNSLNAMSSDISAEADRYQPAYPFPHPLRY